jgi:hypothetical protein
VELSNRVQISSDVLCQEINGESVLLDLKSEAYFGLDATGTRIWQLIEEKDNLQKVFDIMLAEYEVDEELLRNDFSSLLTELSEAGLVSLSPSS